MECPTSNVSVEFPLLCDGIELLCWSLQPLPPSHEGVLQVPAPSVPHGTLQESVWTRAAQVIFPFFFFFVQVLVTSHSLKGSHISYLSHKLSTKLSASHTAVTTLCPQMIPCSSPDHACIHVCCVLRHSTICPHLTYLV